MTTEVARAYSFKAARRDAVRSRIMVAVGGEGEGRQNTSFHFFENNRPNPLSDSLSVELVG
jgi:hypothetical protein